MNDNRIESAIDEAAREMLAGEPGAEFRVRVMARLDKRATAWRSPWVLSPIALAAAVILVVVVGRSARDSSPAAERSAVSAQAAPAALPSPRVEGSAARISEEPRQIPQPSRGQSSLSRPEPLVSPVAEMAPPHLDVTSLALEAIDRGVSLQVPELEKIEPITVAPIGEPQGERQ